MKKLMHDYSAWAEAFCVCTAKKQYIYDSPTWEEAILTYFTMV